MTRSSLLRVDGRVVVPYRATVGRGEGSARTTSPRLLTEQTAKARHAESGSKSATAWVSSAKSRLSSPPLRLLGGGEDLLVRDTAPPKSERRGI